MEISNKHFLSCVSVPVKPIVPPIKLRSPTPPPPIPVIPIKPVKGKVYPPTYPPPDRPGRVTNQLLYIKRNIFSALWNHKERNQMRLIIISKVRHFLESPESVVSYGS